MKENTRTTAAKIINKVITRNQSLNDALSEKKLSNLGNQDQRFIYNLCYGTIRWYFQLLEISEQLLYKALPKKHYDVLCILLIGLYEIIHLKTPDYAAISETVNAVKAIKKSWAAGLINKNLRIFCDKRESLLSKTNPYAHPAWLIEHLKQDWPKHWQSILEANNTQAPITLRINPQFNTKPQYLEKLKENKIAAHSLENLSFGIQIESPVSIESLPGFNAGWCYIQDEAGQHAASLLDLKANMTVLDACCAPGSKTTDILLTQPDLKLLLAVDKDPQRLEKVGENIKRLKIKTTSLEIIATDATQIKDKEFDRILLDAPCSATGIIRRHPDIKILRQKSDIANQVKQQQKLLSCLWPLLKPDGLLLYSSCSILKDENENNIQWFLKQNQNAELKYQKQIFPQINGHDGFFYALLRKNPSHIL